jgi:ABC-type multidrug transport system ATPase subunit
MSDVVIGIDALSKSFGKHLILDKVSLTVRQGERYGLVGLNGAGKTTLIRLLLGVLKPTHGALSVLGSDPWSHDAALFRRMGVVLEHDGFWGNLTFEQNMKIFAEARGIAWKETARYLEERWGRSGLYRNPKPVKQFSRGQRMQCAIARAFLGDAQVYFFDEPAVALDVDAYEHFKGLVLTAGERGATFLISSHQLETIDHLCGRVGMLRDRCVTELEGSGGRNGQDCWSLEADGLPEWGAMIRAVCGSVPYWSEGVWEFTTAGYKSTIPQLIRRLVQAGCDIRTVAPMTGSFSDAIRDEYKKKSLADQATFGKGKS